MAVQLFKGALSPRERELAILRVDWLCGAPFEWGEHVDIAKRYGVSREEIERVTQGSSAPGWSEHERAILKGVEESLANYMISDADLGGVGADMDGAPVARVSDADRPVFRNGSATELAQGSSRR